MDTNTDGHAFGIPLDDKRGEVALYREHWPRRGEYPALVDDALASEDVPSLSPPQSNSVALLLFLGLRPQAQAWGYGRLHPYPGLRPMAHPLDRLPGGSLTH